MWTRQPQAVRRFSNTVAALYGERYKVSVLTPDNVSVDEALDVCIDAFVDEPASVHLEPNRLQRRKGWQQFVEHFKDECTRNGLSVVCVDAKNNNQVAATLLVRDFASPLPSLVCDCIERWKEPDFASETSCEYTFLGPLLEVLVDVDKKYLNYRHRQFDNGIISKEKIEPGTVVDLWMGGTKKEYRRQGLLSKCFDKTTELARKKGYKVAIAECTGLYSSMTMLKLGAKPVAFTNYATFPVSDGSVGWFVDPPHTKLELFSLDLTKLESCL